jgi:hypothetical protein
LREGNTPSDVIQMLNLMNTVACKNSLLLAMKNTETQWHCRHSNTLCSFPSHQYSLT